MNASIQITKETLEKLKRLKISLSASTYDDLINNLIDKAQNVPNSMFGIDKGKMKSITEEYKLIF